MCIPVSDSQTVQNAPSSYAQVHCQQKLSYQRHLLLWLAHKSCLQDDENSPATDDLNTMKTHGCDWVWHDKAAASLAQSWCQRTMKQTFAFSDRNNKQSCSLFYKLCKQTDNKGDATQLTRPNPTRPNLVCVRYYYVKQVTTGNYCALSMCVVWKQSNTVTCYQRQMTEQRVTAQQWTIDYYHLCTLDTW